MLFIFPFLSYETDQKVAAVQNRGRKQCLHFEICKLVLQNPMEPLDRMDRWNVVLHDLGTEDLYRSPKDICITTMEWKPNNLEAGVCIPTNCSACILSNVSLIQVLHRGATMLIFIKNKSLAVQLEAKQA